MRPYESALVREGVTTAADLTESDRASFRRAVAQRCLYGVDVNPMAVQLARLSLWLATLCGDRPLTFFDHQLRAGNSLAGAAVSDVTRGLSGGSRRAAFLPLFDTETLRGSLGSAVMSHIALRDGPEDTLDQIRSKERVFANLSSPRGPLARWKRIVDLWCAAWFQEGVRGMSRGLFQSLLDERTLPGSVAEPLLESAQEVARRERFFHWRLEFPEVFSDGRGEQLIDAGFDAVIGNPPWEMLRGDSGAAATRRTSATAAARLTRFTRGSGIYRFQGGGHANLYQLFVERALSLARRSGRIGLVLPSGFATDHGCANLRRRVLDATTVDSLVSVDNREAIFPVHRGLKFLLFTTTVAGRTPAVPFRAGPRTSADFDRLPEAGPDPEAVALSRELLERMSGEQLAIPDVRTQADAALAARLVFAHAGAGDAEGWGLRFGRELNATDDRRHFSPDAAGALPVIEGKQIQPFGVAVERSNLFIGPAAAARLLPGAPFNCVRLAYRDVASSTNRVTLIAAILPAGTVTTHTLFCLKTKLDGEAQHFLCGMLNSFVANYLVRIRVTTHVTVAIIGCLPLPKPGRDTEEFRLMASVAMKLAHNPADLAASAWHQALAARIYGLTKGEFAHVLSTFPLVDRSARDSAMTAFLGTL